MRQLVNADDTSVIEIKTAMDTSLKAKRNYIFPDYVTRNNHSCTIKMIVNLFPTH